MSFTIVVFLGMVMLARLVGAALPWRSLLTHPALASEARVRGPRSA